MEQHPVPQNVTTFQFRLIGDMTIKQFGYLVAGAILAFIAYKLPLPFIITWPLAFIFGFLGVGFAFIPVEERPMDVWVFSFFKSIYSPTQYIWSHEPQTTSTATSAPQLHKPVSVPGQQLHASPPAAGHPPKTQPAASAVPASSKTVLSNIFQQGTPAASDVERPASIKVTGPKYSFIDDIVSLFRTTSVPPPPPIAPPAPSVTGRRPTPLQLQPTAENAAATDAMHQKITQLEETLKTLEERLAVKTVTEDRVLELQKQLTEVLAQKSKTEEDLVTLKRQITPRAPATPKPSPPPAQGEPDTKSGKQPTQSRGTVNVITTQAGAVKAGLPRLTNTPNVITGLVKDDTGNFLPGILVTVTNHEEMPMRALKTNKLGQFAASTPLASGTYFVEIEDPRSRFTFSRVQITLNGAVVPVLEIIAKSEKALTRERLAQEIFGKQS